MMYSWRDFSVDVVAGVKAGDPRHVDKSNGGWITCPLVGHSDHRLAWRNGNYRHGSEPCGSPAASFRVTPTYVLVNPVDNFIVGASLIRRLLESGSGKAETRRLGNENSEDAVTWNVFRSLQEAGGLAFAANFFGAEPLGEPELYAWGQRVLAQEFASWEELQAARDQLERGKKYQTEPDVCLHVAGWGWIFVEAKFGSPTDVYEVDRREEWIERYSGPCPGLFNDDAIRQYPLDEFPQQLLRNVALVHLLTKESGENSMVVALVRDGEDEAVVDWVQQCLAPEAGVAFRRETWENLYLVIPTTNGITRQCRRFMENKSLKLRQAFALE